MSCTRLRRPEESGKQAELRKPMGMISSSLQAYKCLHSTLNLIDSHFQKSALWTLAAHFLFSLSIPNPKNVLINPRQDCPKENFMWTDPEGFESDSSSCPRALLCPPLAGAGM